MVFKRIKFDSQGRLASVDGAWTDFQQKNEYENGQADGETLKTSVSLGFLKEQGSVEHPAGRASWSLHQEGKFLEPLLFSNGKTQEDIVEEVVSLIKQGKKVIFIHGVCGTGKSAIALNIARL